ncbi:hypothetical protein Q3G72_024267 [Acer saccharum]|nr:hypothetical protein Q3G72_024267 [Acer saccharum]
MQVIAFYSIWFMSFGITRTSTAVLVPAATGHSHKYTAKGGSEIALTCPPGKVRARWGSSHTSEPRKFLQHWVQLSWSVCYTYPPDLGPSGTVWDRSRSGPVRSQFRSGGTCTSDFISNRHDRRNVLTCRL